jgi:hypothetical protein
MVDSGRVVDERMFRRSWRLTQLENTLLPQTRRLLQDTQDHVAQNRAARRLIAQEEEVIALRKKLSQVVV